MVWIIEVPVHSYRCGFYWISSIGQFMLAKHASTTLHACYEAMKHRKLYHRIQMLYDVCYQKDYIIALTARMKNILFHAMLLIPS